jgi:hypothetical protein
MATVAKFKCNEIGKRTGWGDAKFVYGAKFSVVMGNNEENKKFFLSTPSGSIDISTLREDFFEVGEEYFVTFEKAPKE